MVEWLNGQSLSYTISLPDNLPPGQSLSQEIQNVRRIVVQLVFPIFTQMFWKLNLLRKNAAA